MVSQRSCRKCFLSGSLFDNDSQSKCIRQQTTTVRRQGGIFPVKRTTTTEGVLTTLCRVASLPWITNITHVLHKWGINKSAPNYASVNEVSPRSGGGANSI